MSKTARLVWLLPLLVLFALAQDAQEVLTNDSILKMVKAGLPENVIVEMVRSHPSTFVLTSSQMIDLNRAGVPASVLSAMIARAAATPGEPAAGSDWVVRSVTDPLTGELKVEASATLPVEGGASVRAVSTCGISHMMESVNAAPSQMAHALQGLMDSLDDHAPRVESNASLNLDSRVLSFRLQYVPKTASGPALRRSQLTQSVTENAFGGGATISAPGSCVFMRVSVDGHGREGVQSDVCEIPNTAALGFASIRPQDIAGAMTNLGAGDNAGVNRFAAGLMNTMAEATDTTIATMKEAMQANEILVELPLTDGGSALVRIRPRIPSFQQFVSKCLATFPDPAIGVSNSRVPGQPGVAQKSPLQTLSNRSYSGTADGFVRDLPGFMGRAANAMGFAAEDYARETAFIVDAVRTCAQVTPQTAGTPGRGARIDLNRLGPQYKVCNHITYVSDELKINRRNQRGIELTISGVGNRGAAGEDPGFYAGISFTIQNDDSARFRNIGFDNLGILAAMIYSSESAVKQPVAATALQKLTDRRFTGTAAGFAAELPGFIQRAARAMSLDPEIYSKEISFISKVIGTCAGVTPAMARSTAQYGQPHLLKLGEQYKFCQTVAGFQNISDAVKTYDKNLERGIQIQVNPIGTWISGEGINVRVYFTPLQEERLTSPSTYFDTLGIVAGTVSR